VNVLGKKDPYWVYFLWPVRLLHLVCRWIDWQCPNLQGSLHFESWYPVLIILSALSLGNFNEFRFSWLRLASHLTFLMKCKVHDFPKGLLRQASYHSHRSSEIILQGEDRHRIQSLKHCALNKNRMMDDVQKHISCKYCIN
jgi:hypothetical protein